MGRANRNLNAAAGRLRAIDSRTLSSRVAPAYAEISAAVDTASTSFAAADRAVQVLPTMLGKDGPKKYLLMFENNAEIRATGGLPGAYALVTTDKGKISLTRQGAPKDIGRFDKPVLPQSEAEKQIYFDQIATFFQDTNFTPEFPRTAELVREMWKRSQGRAARRGDECRRGHPELPPARDRTGRGARWCPPDREERHRGAAQQGLLPAGRRDSSRTTSSATSPS